MNQLLQAYVADTQFPNANGIEHIQMLRRRSELAALEHQLNREERRQLAEADVRLATHAAEFLAELGRFVDLAAERRRLDMPRSHWWWYLDDPLIKVDLILGGRFHAVEKERQAAYRDGRMHDRKVLAAYQDGLMFARELLFKEMTQMDNNNTHCGHPRSSIVSGDDGTNWCKDCEAIVALD